MQAKYESGCLVSIGLRYLAIGTILGIAGCGASPKMAPPAPQSTSGGTASGTSTSTNNSSTTIPPELVQKVNDLVRLDKEYINVAKGIQTFDDFKKNADTLSGLSEQLSSTIEDIMIAEAKLTAAQKAIFDSKYYAPAKPVIEEQRREKARVYALVP